jgi:hypothetical protein
MALTGREVDKIVHSLARWLAGLPPMWSKNVYYFEKYTIAKEIMRQLKPFRGTRICPFCKKRCKKISGFVTHIISKHWYDIEEMFGLPHLAKKKLSQLYL